MSPRPYAAGKIFSILLLLVSLGWVEGRPAVNPWVHDFTPSRIRYVSPLGSGQGGSDSDPMSLSAAIASAAPGDLVWMMEGTYSGGHVITGAGAADRPIVYRALPGHRVVVEGTLQIRGAHTWIWGLEITNPGGAGDGDSGVQMLAPGVHLINNVIHHQWDKNGIGAWNSGPGQVVYGNIVFANGEGDHHPHNIYSQNDFAQNGYKYFVGNVLLDAASVCGGCFNFHAYTEGGLIKGFHLQDNVIANGRFLIGGYGEPADREVVLRNHFYNSLVQFGYRRPTQVEFRDNYLGRTSLHTEWFWGAGETRYQQTAPNVFEGNTILLPPGPHVAFRTSAYLASGRCEGCPRIRATDTFDGNVYSAPFTGTFHADNTNRGAVDLQTWRSASAAAGKAFDGSSVEVAPPSGVRRVLIPNEYEPGRAHLVVFNWARAANVTVDLSSVVAPGAGFAVHPARDLHGDPVSSGAYAGPVVVPMGGQEFAVFVVLAEEDAGGSPSLVSPAPGSVLPGSVVEFEWSANGAPVTEWWLFAGSSPGASDYFNSGSLGRSLSGIVSGLPTDGRSIHVRLSYRISGQWSSSDYVFQAAAAESMARMNIDLPTHHEQVNGPFRVRGWAVDLAGEGTGIDAVRVSISRGGQLVLRADAMLGIRRPDVAAYFGDPSCELSGFELTVDERLAPGSYEIWVQARSTVSGQFEIARTVSVVVQQSGSSSAKRSGKSSRR